MGNFRVTVGVSAPGGSHFEHVEALVDTGATYTQLHESLLRSLGVVPLGNLSFRLANGQSVMRDVSEAPMRIGNMVRTSPVIFGSDDSDNLLGAVTLEIFGLGVDPVDQKLIPVEGLLVGIIESANELVTQSPTGRRQK